MQTINNLIKFPKGTPIDAVQARIVKLYKRELKETAYGSKYKQDGMLEDSTGQVKFSAWEHPELAPLEGKEFVIHADGKGKGLKINSWSGNDGKLNVSLEVGKQGQFQHVVVYNQNKGLPDDQASQPASSPIPAPQSAPKAAGTPEKGHSKTFVHGATAGAAVNKAIDILNSASHGAAYELAKSGGLETEIVKIGGQIVRAAQRLENGDLGQPAPEKKHNPASANECDEQVPF